MAMILGKKVGMTQVYDEGGNLLTVTVINAGPCAVLQTKSVESDGYSAVQIGFDDVKANRHKKPEVGHCSKAKTSPKKFIKEMRLLEGVDSELNVGDLVTVSAFSECRYVDVIGTSKGKGFAGGMKRHNFGGFPASHGCKRRHRAPGAISSFASDAGHGGNLKKGKRMAGHMGHTRVTSKNNSLVSVDEDRNLLVVKGNVPGPAGGYLIIRSSNKS